MPLAGGGLIAELEQGSPMATGKTRARKRQNVQAAGSKGLHGRISPAKVVLSRSSALSPTNRVHSFFVIWICHHGKVPSGPSNKQELGRSCKQLRPGFVTDCGAAACTAAAPHGAHHLLQRRMLRSDASHVLAS